MQPALTQYIVREERPEDRKAVKEVCRFAFKGDSEAALIDRLSADGLVVLSMVAEQDGRIVGQIVFSRLPIETESGRIDAVALAPMAVRPDKQLHGIGSSLVRRGLALCRDRGERIAIVLGHPTYYPRFGFSPHLAKKLKSPFSGDMFMACELMAGALDGVSGTVHYPNAFETI